MQYLFVIEDIRFFLHFLFLVIRKELLVESLINIRFMISNGIVVLKEPLVLQVESVGDFIDLRATTKAAFESVRVK